MPRPSLVITRGGALALAAALLSSPPADAQAHYSGSLQSGTAFMLDRDDPDPAGSWSLSATLDRRHGDRRFSLGVETGFHHFLDLRQDLSFAPGSASSIRDTRKAWRLTPYLRWGTQGPLVRLYGQAGLGLYIQRSEYAQREVEEGVVTVEASSATTDALAGLHIGAGLQLFPGLGAIGIALGFRSHMVFEGTGFNTAEIGLVWRGRRPRVDARSDL